MADGSIPVQDPGVTDSLLDTEVLTVGLDTVHRERMQIAGDTDVAIATLSQGNPQPDTWALAVRQPPNNDIGELFASTSYTTTNTADLDNPGFPGIAVVVDVTTPGTGSITLTIEGFDAVSGKHIVLLSGAVISTTSTNVYKVHPTLPAVANVTAQDSLWAHYRIKVTANNANPMTYSVGATFLP